MSTRTDNQPGGETQRGMKIARWAAAPTLLMAVLNIPAGLDSSGSHVPAGIGWAATVVGLAGLVAGIALLRRVSLGVPAVAVVGAVNLVGAIAAMVEGWQGGPVGLVLSAAALGLLGPTVRRP